MRAVRFNVCQGGSETLKHLDRLARRVHELAGWHTELYIDAADLPDLGGTFASQPQVSIDHLGLSSDGLPHLLRLAEHAVHVKATGFSRGDLDVPDALRRLADANPGALLGGTDFPNTRAPRAFADTDLDLIVHALQDDRLVQAAFTGNADALYRPSNQVDPGQKQQARSGFLLGQLGERGAGLHAAWPRIVGTSADRRCARFVRAYASRPILCRALGRPDHLLGGVGC